MFVQALIDGNKLQCTEILQQYLDNKIAIPQLYEQLLKRALYQVGSLWEANQISVATEHLATAVTEGLLNSIYALIIPEKTTAYTAVLTCVEGERHQVGAKMVADIFELHGWNSLFLGANTPLAELIRFVDAQKPNILGLSLTIYFNMAILQNMLTQLTQKFPNLKIIVGGQGFTHGGGADIERAFPEVTYIATLEQLESLLNKYGSS